MKASFMSRLAANIQNWYIFEKVAVHKSAPNTRRAFKSTLLACGLFCSSVWAQTPATPLPANYKTIFENADFLVMRVHYGPHEFVPMHDHTVYPTVFVYLNDAGALRIDHEAPEVYSLQRPRTLTGSFRVSPRTLERHSITNLSDLPSDFLRVELKSIPPNDLKHVVRGVGPSPLPPGIRSEFQDAALRIDCIVCPATTPCEAPPTATRSLLVAITLIEFDTPEGKRELQAGDVLWLPASTSNATGLSPGAQALRISLLYPE
jgi:hypothetical protein